MEIASFWNTWVSLFNVSLKMHDDVIAGRQINQICNYIITNFNEYIKPPCSSLIGTSLINGMSSEEEVELGRTSLFAEPVGSADEGGLETDEGVVERSLSLNLPFVLNFDSVEREGVECVRRALEELVGEIIAGTEPAFDADDEDEVYVCGSGWQWAERWGRRIWGFTFTDAFMRATLLSETLLEGIVSSSELQLC